MTGENISLGKGKNNFGSLNNANLKAGLKMEQLTDKQKLIFQKFDADGNNVLDDTEAQSLLASLVKISDHGKITKHEAKTYLRQQGLKDVEAEELLSLLALLSEQGENIEHATQNDDGTHVEIQYKDGVKETLDRSGENVTQTLEFELDGDDVTEVRRNGSLTNKTTVSTVDNTTVTTQTEFGEGEAMTLETVTIQNAEDEVQTITTTEYDGEKGEEIKLTQVIEDPVANTTTELLFDENEVVNEKTVIDGNKNMTSTYSVVDGKDYITHSEQVVADGIVKKTDYNYDTDADGNIILAYTEEDNGRGVYTTTEFVDIVLEDSNINPEDVEKFVTIEDTNEGSVTEELVMKSGNKTVFHTVGEADNPTLQTVTNLNGEGNRVTQLVIKNGETFEVEYDGNGNTMGVIVQNGESVERIAKKFGVDADELRRVNADKLHNHGNGRKGFNVGESIVIPREIDADEFATLNAGRKDAAGAKAEYAMYVAQRNAEDAELAARKPYVREVDRQTDPDFEAIKDCKTYEDLAKALFGMEGNNNPSKRQISLRVEELITLNGGTVDARGNGEKPLPSGKIKISLSPDKFQEIHEKKIEDQTKTYERYKRGAMETGAQIADLYRTAVCQYNGRATSEYADAVSRLTPGNVVEVLRAYDKKTGNAENLLTSVYEEWKSVRGNDKHSDQGAVEFILRALVKRAEKAGLTDDYIPDNCKFGGHDGTTIKGSLHSIIDIATKKSKWGDFDNEYKDVLIIMDAIEALESYTDEQQLFQQKGLTADDMSAMSGVVESGYESAQTDFDAQVADDGWIANSVDEIAHWFGSDNYEDDVRADLGAYSGQMKRLSEAAKAGNVSEFKAIYKEMFGIDYTPQIHNMMMSWKDLNKDIAIATSYKQEADAFKSSFGNVINNGDFSYENTLRSYSNHYMQAMKQAGRNMSADEAMNELAQVIEQYLPDGVSYQNASEQQKKAALKTIITTEYNNYNTGIQKALKGRSLEEMQERSSNYANAIFGIKGNDINQRVASYVESQQKADAIATMGLKTIAAVALCLIPGVGVVAAAALVAATSLAIDVSDELSTKNGMTGKEFTGFLGDAAFQGGMVFLGGTAAKAIFGTPLKNAAGQVMKDAAGNVMMKGGINQLNIAGRTVQVGAGGKAAMMFTSDVAMGAGAEYITTGRVTAQGVAMAATFSAAGNLVALRGMRSRRVNGGNGSHTSETPVTTKATAGRGGTHPSEVMVGPQKGQAIVAENKALANKAGATGEELATARQQVDQIGNRNVRRPSQQAFDDASQFMSADQRAAYNRLRQSNLDSDVQYILEGGRGFSERSPYMRKCREWIKSCTNPEDLNAFKTMVDGHKNMTAGAREELNRLISARQGAIAPRPTASRENVLDMLSGKKASGKGFADMREVDDVIAYINATKDPAALDELEAALQGVKKSPSAKRAISDALAGRRNALAEHPLNPNETYTDPHHIELDETPVSGGRTAEGGRTIDFEEALEGMPTSRAAETPAATGKPAETPVVTSRAATAENTFDSMFQNSKLRSITGGDHPQTNAGNRLGRRAIGELQTEIDGFCANARSVEDLQAVLERLNKVVTNPTEIANMKRQVQSAIDNFGSRAVAGAKPAGGTHETPAATGRATTAENTFDNMFQNSQLRRITGGEHPQTNAGNRLGGKAIQDLQAEVDGFCANARSVEDLQAVLERLNKVVTNPTEIANMRRQVQSAIDNFGSRAVAGARVAGGAHETPAATSRAAETHADPHHIEVDGTPTPHTSEGRTISFEDAAAGVGTGRTAGGHVEPVKPVGSERPAATRSGETPANPKPGERPAAAAADEAPAAAAAEPRKTFGQRMRERHEANVQRREARRTERAEAREARRAEKAEAREARDAERARQAQEHEELAARQRAAQAREQEAIRNEISGANTLKDLEGLQDRINQLPRGEERRALQSELNNKTAEIKRAGRAARQAERAENARLNSEYADIGESISGARTTEQIAKIQERIDRLPEGPKKNALQRQLNSKATQIKPVEEEVVAPSTPKAETAEPTITKDYIRSLTERRIRKMSNDELLDAYKNCNLYERQGTVEIVSTKKDGVGYLHYSQDATHQQVLIENELNRRGLQLTRTPGDNGQTVFGVKARESLAPKAAPRQTEFDFVQSVTEKSCQSMTDDELLQSFRRLKSYEAEGTRHQMKLSDNTSIVVNDHDVSAQKSIIRNELDRRGLILKGNNGQYEIVPKPPKVQPTQPVRQPEIDPNPAHIPTAAERAAAERALARLESGMPKEYNFGNVKMASCRQGAGGEFDISCRWQDGQQVQVIYNKETGKTYILERNNGTGWRQGDYRGFEFEGLIPEDIANQFAREFPWSNFGSSKSDAFNMMNRFVKGGSTPAAGGHIAADTSVAAPKGASSKNQAGTSQPSAAAKAGVTTKKNYSGGDIKIFREGTWAYDHSVEDVNKFLKDCGIDHLDWQTHSSKTRFTKEGHTEYYDVRYHDGKTTILMSDYGKSGLRGSDRFNAYTISGEIPRNIVDQLVLKFDWSSISTADLAKVLNGLL